MPPAAVAAAMAANRRQREQAQWTGIVEDSGFTKRQVKEAEARQQALYRQEQSRKQAGQKRVAQWAKQYDKSGGGDLTANEVAAMIAHQTGQQPSDEALQFVLNFTGRYGDDSRLHVALEAAVRVLDKVRIAQLVWRRAAECRCTRVVAV
jgi:hypothetical protein